MPIFRIQYLETFAQMMEVEAPSLEAAKELVLKCDNSPNRKAHPVGPSRFLKADSNGVFVMDEKTGEFRGIDNPENHHLKTELLPPITELLLPVIKSGPGGRDDTAAKISPKDRNTSFPTSLGRKWKKAGIGYYLYDSEVGGGDYVFAYTEKLLDRNGRNGRWNLWGNGGSLNDYPTLKALKMSAAKMRFINC